jgi:hypothetical protein
MAAALNEAAFASIKASGIQFDPIPTATRAGFRQRMSGVIDGARKRLGAALVDQVVAGSQK